MRYISDIVLILFLLFILSSLIYAGFMINPYLGIGFVTAIFIFFLFILIKSISEYDDNKNNTGEMS
jgi:hypothetical protein